MIKSIAYFPSQCALNAKPVLDAFLGSCRTAGIQFLEGSMTADAAVIWSVLWSGRMSGNQQVYQHYRQQGLPVIVIDVGALYRGETWKIAVNSITAEGYYGHRENLDWDRPKKLGISLAINVSRNPRIVIASQHAHSLQVAGLPDMETWIQTQIHQIRAVTDRPIVVRPHPRSAINMDLLGGMPPGVSVEHPVKVINTYDSYNLAFDCHAMVNYNSGPGIQAALAGTRPIVDVSSLAHPVSINFESIERSYDVERDQWLVEICHTEYTIKEISQGLWLKRIDSALN